MKKPHPWFAACQANRLPHRVQQPFHNHLTKSSASPSTSFRTFLQDFVEQAGTDRFARVHRYHGSTTVRMLQEMMAPLDPHDVETRSPKCCEDIASP